MTSSEITRPLHELFAKIYQTERESLESQQKIRGVKKRINTVKMNIHKIKQNMHEKDMEMAEQNVKLALIQSQLNIALAKKKALAETLHKLEADCTAKIRERDHLREQYNNRHNAFCELVENLESLYQRHMNK
ncbi:DEAD box ATP-dependent RNA helicase family member protein [Echinococcus multilocularis]|uniref:DEAD box ATP-dependent RNA helicase family member protein n=1 Tax=Echinococcus multilocularis TaxID=6211 RepID=A0A068YGL9_ECHMU|nr:DEAD box ATP-dependent RNA helicase family member protein [Echinococcus multilocularis]